MSAPYDFPLSFNSICILKGKYLFTATPDDDQYEDMGGFYILYENKWFGGIHEIPTIGSTVADEPYRTPVFLGVNRQVGRMVKEEEAYCYETILESEETDSLLLGPAREIRTIGQHAYVCGMSRSVHKCLGRDQWVRIDHDVRSEEDDNSGFKSIDGFSEQDIYAVGFNGEIWHYNGKGWSAVDSPVNVTLNKVICASSGDVYIVCGSGLLLHGRNDQWRTYSLETKKNLYAVTYFKGQVFAASLDGLYKLQDDELVSVKIQSKEPIEYEPHEAFGMLAASDDIMWCGGAKCLMFTHDGITWEEVMDYDLPAMEEIE